MDNQQIFTVYNNAIQTDSFKIHNDFLNLLLSDQSEKSMVLHYTFFNESSNSDLKRILGKGFLKRGEKGLEFLLSKLKTENDPLKKSYIIHLIGLSYNKKYLPNIIPFLQDENEDIRYKSIVATGWLGDSETVDILKLNYFSEKVNLLKGFTITAMRQIFFRNEDTKDKIVAFICDEITDETNDELLAIMIVVLQDLTKVKYGLKEDTDTGEISGNIIKAKNKIIQKFNL